MDATTRARLDDYLGAAWPPTRGTQEVVHRDDLTAVLAAYDAQAVRLAAYRAVCTRFVDGLARGAPPPYWVQLRREAAAVLEQSDDE